MSLSDLLIEAAAALESAGVGYVLTGSLASSLQGEPRFTHDVDLVVEVDMRAVDTIIQKLKWAAGSGGSERQIGDAVGVYQVQAGTLDEAYLDDWVHRLNLSELLLQVRARAAD
jgi:hypothetical protein